MENLGSSSSLKDLFYALKVNGILKCKVDKGVFQVILCFRIVLVRSRGLIVSAFCCVFE